VSLNALRGGIAFSVISGPLVWAIEWFADLRAAIELDQFVSAVFGLALAWVFLSPKQREMAPLDWLLAFFAIAIAGTTAVGIETFSLRLFLGGTDLLILSGGLVALTIIACQRVLGWPMTVLVIVFLAFGAIARYLPPPISAPPANLETYLVYIAFGGDALIGQALRIITTIVIAFVLFGRMFELMGGTAFFVLVAQRLSGGSPGGPLKVAVITSSLFGSISGSTTANVVTSGSFSIPMMKQVGLRPHQAAAIEAVSSTGGQIMPPVMGIAAFLMVEIAGIPYRDLIAAALLPALLFFVSVFLQADGLARRMQLPRQPKSAIKLEELATGLLRIAVPIGLVVGSLILMPYAPAHGAVLGCVACLPLAITRYSNLKSLLSEAVRLTVLAGETSCRVVITGATIGILLGVINATGLGVAGALAIEKLASDGLFLALIAAAIASFFLGLGLATTAVYAVVGTLIAPSLVSMGVPVVGAHLFVFYSAMLSMITPPVALACLTASGLADASFMRTCTSAMRFGWSLFLLPFLFVLYPQLLLIGEPIDIVMTVAACFFGVALVSIGLARDLAPSRLSLTTGGLFLAGVLALLPWVGSEFKVATVGLLGVGWWVLRLQVQNKDAG